MEMSKVKDWIKYNSKLHLIDSTAMLTIGTPLSAAMEVGIAGMSNDVSINARLIAAGLAYGGFGSVFSRGRDLWRKGFKITDKTKEKIQGAHDIAYFTTLNVAFSPLFYYVSGSRDFKEIAYGTVAAAALNISLGWPAGYVLDTMRSLTGVKESERVPSKIRALGLKTKKSLVALALAGSLAITAGIYKATSDKDESYLPEERIEEVENMDHNFNGL